MKSERYFDPTMPADEAARLWIRINECTDAGRAATIQQDDGTISVRYQETANGIIIILRDGTGVPVPYRYDGSPCLLC